MSVTSGPTVRRRTDRTRLSVGPVRRVMSEADFNRLHPVLHTAPMALPQLVLPQFGGRLHEDPEGFLVTCERQFAICRTPEMHKVHLAGQQLQDQAASLWKNLQSFITTWPMFADRLSKKFASPHVLAILRAQLYGERHVECDKVYHQAGNLRRHVRIVHENIGGVYICEVCGKSLSNTSVLRDHMRTNTGERPYTCSTCGKGFKAAIRLKEHTLTHTGQRPHVCTTCGKRFTQRSSMVIHMRMHTGERPYPCTICLKEFASRSLMKIHSKVHGTALADI